MAVTLDNIKAMLSRDRGEKDLASSQCVFAQAYRQLSDTDPKLLRTVWDGERVFQVRGGVLWPATRSNLDSFVGFLRLIPSGADAFDTSSTAFPRGNTALMTSTASR